MLGTVLAVLVSACSTAYADDVVFSEAEIDSVVAYIDSLELRVGQLAADLQFQRSIAAADSVLAARKLELLERQFEETLALYKEDRPGWLERLLTDPKLWLAVGVWVGLQGD